MLRPFSPSVRVDLKVIRGVEMIAGFEVNQSLFTINDR